MRVGQASMRFGNGDIYMIWIRGSGRDTAIGVAAARWSQTQTQDNIHDGESV